MGWGGGKELEREIYSLVFWGKRGAGWVIGGNDYDQNQENY